MNISGWWIHVITVSISCTNVFVFYFYCCTPYNWVGGFNHGLIPMKEESNPWYKIMVCWECNYMVMCATIDACTSIGILTLVLLFWKSLKKLLLALKGSQVPLHQSIPCLIIHAQVRVKSHGRIQPIHPSSKKWATPPISTQCGANMFTQ